MLHCFVDVVQIYRNLLLITNDTGIFSMLLRIFEALLGTYAFLVEI